MYLAISVTYQFITCFWIIRCNFRLCNVFRRCLCNDVFATMLLQRCFCDDAFATMPLRRSLCDDTFTAMPLRQCLSMMPSDYDLATMPFWWCLCDDAFATMPLQRYLCDDAFATMPLRRLHIIIFAWNRSSFFHNVKKCQHYWHLKWKQRDFEYLQKAVSIEAWNAHVTNNAGVELCARQ